MNLTRSAFFTLAGLLLASAVPIASANEPGGGAASMPADPPAAADRAPVPVDAVDSPVAARAPVLDPFMQDLLLAMAAAMLREAAASPDPVAALGESLERKLSLALSSPEAMRALEAALARGLQDVPADLREPLASFAGSLLRGAQRDFGRGRPRY